MCDMFTAEDPPLKVQERKTAEVQTQQNDDGLQVDIEFWLEHGDAPIS